MSHFKFTAENAEFAEKSSFAGVTMKKKALLKKEVFSFSTGFLFL